MRLTDLCPYWDDVHDELIDLLELLREEHLDYKPNADARSVRQLVLDLAHEQRFHACALAGGYSYRKPTVPEDRNKAALIELLEKTRVLMERTLEPFTPAGLHAVRKLPANPEHNQPETNVTINWLFWRALEREIYYAGQIAQRIQDQCLSPNHWRSHNDERP